MSFAQPGQSEPLSAGLTLNLSSNNPFRNRAASPSSSTGLPSPREPPPRPVSRNPFLDGSATDRTTQQVPDKMATTATGTQPRAALSGNAAELFDNLTLSDKSAPPASGMRPPPARSTTEGPPPSYSDAQRRENVPPRGPPGHRPSTSQESAMRSHRRPPGGSSASRTKPSGELDIFADPPESSGARRAAERRPRRNSESSVASRQGALLSPEDEKKRQERKRRERRHRERDAKDGKSRKPERKLDVIDKLDATSIYGAGLFHHDGPFDACNPHRNRQGSRRAPMQAFPKDSLNNVMGGGGPLNKRPDHATFLGHNNDEAFKDYSKGGVGYSEYEPYANGSTRPGPTRQESLVVSATSKVEPVHGDETLGLGTSTFLEGAPASKTAIQRREEEQSLPAEGGLSRKKSLAQKFRAMNGGPRRDYGPSGRMTNPEGVYSPEARTPGGTKVETNPFFDEFSKGDDTITTTKREPTVTIAEPSKPTGRSRAPSSPGARFGSGLERRSTNDDSAAKTGGGFLARVKSLKGPRKPRNQAGGEA